MKQIGVAVAVVILGTANIAWAQAAAEENQASDETTTETAQPDANNQGETTSETVEEPTEQEAAQSETSSGGEQPTEAAPAPADENSDTAGQSTETVAQPVAEPTPTTPEETPATPAGFEEIEATPTVEGDTSVSNVIEVGESDGDDKPYGAMVAVSTSVGAGSFVGDSVLREKSDYVGQTYDIRPSYKFDIIGGHELKLTGRFVATLEFTKPDTNPSRRFVPVDTRLYVSDAEIYKEPFTDITISGSATFYFPTSYESINVTKRWFAMRGTVGLDRSIGPVDLAYRFASAKNFNSSKVRVETVSRTTLRAGDNAQFTGGGAATVGKGFGNTSYDFMNTFEVVYNYNEALSVGYSLLVWNTFRYKVSSCDELPQFSSANADCGRGRADMLWPTLEVGYKLDDVMDAVYPLPFSLAVAGGITALHPAQTPDNDGIIWPFFYHAFAKNRAANNYGEIYFDLIGTY